MSLEGRAEVGKVIIFARDMAAMKKFYGGTLGLRLIPETMTPEWVEFEAGGVVLALHAIPPAIAATIHMATPALPRGDTPIKVIFLVPDLAAARAHLIEQGATVFEMRPWAAFDAIDPEGNVFQLQAAAAGQE